MYYKSKYYVIEKLYSVLQVEIKMRQLKTREIAEMRQQLLQEQNGLCALCQEQIEPGSAVLDHDHKSGQIRSVLHRGCNAFLGHIENNLARNQITESRLKAILANIESYIKATKPVLHSTYRTPEQRRERQRQRAKQRRQQNKKP